MDKDELNNNLQQIWELLRELDTKVTLHIEEESGWKPQMLEVIKTWNTTQGVLTLIKWCAAVSASITAVWAWIHQHITWK